MPSVFICFHGRFGYRLGDVVFTWQGYKIETSVTVLVVAVAAIAVSMMLAWSIVRAITRSLASIGKPSR